MNSASPNQPTPPTYSLEPGTVRRLIGYFATPGAARSVELVISSIPGRRMSLQLCTVRAGAWKGCATITLHNLADLRRALDQFESEARAELASLPRRPRPDVSPPGRGIPRGATSPRTVSR